MAADYSASAILAQLDMCADDFDWLVLDNVNVVHIGARLSAWRSDAHWAIIIEQIGVMLGAPPLHASDNCVHVYGNCARGELGVTNTRFLPWLALAPQSLLDDDDAQPWARGHALLRPHGALGRIGEVTVEVSGRARDYDEAGIGLRYWPYVHVVDATRWVYERHRALRFLPRARLEAELREVPELLLVCDRWHHPEQVWDRPPSQEPVMQSLAEALVSGEAARFDPGVANTSWRYWTETGF